MKLFDTSLPTMWSKMLFEEHNADLAPEHMDKIFDVAVTGVADILNTSKSMEKPTSFTFRKLNKQVVMIATVQYFPNADKSKPGNYSLTFSFNESDIPKNSQVIDITDPTTYPYFIGIGGKKYGMRFESDSDIVLCLTDAFDSLHKWLDENAKEGETVSIEADGLFQARVAIEGKEKVFAIEPDGEIKNLIKDDASIER